MYKFFLFDENSNEENELAVSFAHFGFAKENSFYEKKSISGENNSHLP